jgi:Ca-activated chloride channel family protein
MKVESFLERPRVAVGEAAVGWILRVTGEAGASTRIPINLALVIDVSGSMAGEKLARVKQAARWVVEHLQPTDTVSVVAFEADVRVVVPARAVGDRQPILDGIASLQAGGGTNLSGGWSEGVFQVQRHHRRQAANRVILLTDGEANRGVIDPAKLCAVARQACVGDSQPVSTTTVGVGQRFHEDLLLDMAKEGGGAFYYVASAASIGDCFQTELASVGELIAQNVTLELKPAPWVKELKQLTSHPARWEGEDHVFTVRLGDLSAGGTRQAGLELQAVTEEVADEWPLLAGTLRWLDLSGETPQPRQQSVRVGVAVGAEASAVDATVERELAVLRIARARRKAIRLADARQLDEALAVLGLARQAAQQGLLSSDGRVADHLASLARLERVLRDEPGSYGPLTQSRKEAVSETYHMSTATLYLR